MATNKSMINLLERAAEIIESLGCRLGCRVYTIHRFHP